MKESGIIDSASDPLFRRNAKIHKTRLIRRDRAKSNTDSPKIDVINATTLRGIVTADRAVADDHEAVVRNAPPPSASLLLIVQFCIFVDVISTGA